MKKMQKPFLIFLMLSALTIPALTFAHGGVDDGDEDTGVTNSVVSEVKSHGFTLATTWSPKWWMFIGTSLILMGLLSMYVEKYLKVE
jgi:hypothetical protein